MRQNGTLFAMPRLHDQMTIPQPQEDSESFQLPTLQVTPHGKPCVT